MAVIATVVAFASCNKDDENKGNDYLVGTTWESNTDWATLVIEFKTDAKCDLVTIERGKEVERQTASYIYDAPKITITATYEDEVESMSGTVSGNKMTFTEGDESLVFTKK